MARSEAGGDGQVGGLELRPHKPRSGLTSQARASQAMVRPRVGGVWCSSHTVKDRAGAPTAPLAEYELEATLARYEGGWTVAPLYARRPPPLDRALPIADAMGTSPPPFPPRPLPPPLQYLRLSLSAAPPAAYVGADEGAASGAWLGAGGAGVANSRAAGGGASTGAPEAGVEVSGGG